MTIYFGSCLSNYYRLAFPVKHSLLRKLRWIKTNIRFSYIVSFSFIYLQKLHIQEINGKSKYFLYPLLNPDLLWSIVPHCALLRFFVNTKSMPDLFWKKTNKQTKKQEKETLCYDQKLSLLIVTDRDFLKIISIILFVLFLFSFTRGNFWCGGSAALEVRRDPAFLHPSFRAHPHCKILIFANLKR